MEFFIKKNATLPLLKMQVVKDGRGEYQEFMRLVEESTIYFSMQDVKTGGLKVNTKFAGFVEKNFIEPNSEPEYYLYFKFSKHDTNRIGRYEGQFLLKNDNGTLVFPIREKLYINIEESYLEDDLDYNPCYNSTFQCCVVGPPDSVTIELTLLGNYEPGSVNINYTITSNKKVPYDLTLLFTDNIQVISGDSIVVSTGVTINKLTTSGSTQVTLDYDFNNLQHSNYFTNVFVSPENQTYKVVSSESTIYSTPTNTPTPTITPSITSTLTPTPTITTSITPSVTITPSITSTLTPTPTPTMSYPTINFKGLYVNDFNTIIGDVNEENNLKYFIQQNGFNSIYCYDLSGVLSTTSGRTSVRIFNTDVRSYGINIIGGIGGSSNTLIGPGDNSRLSYNNGCTNDSEKYDYLNLENEFWNYPNVGTVTFDNWKTYVNEVNYSISSTTTLFDSYIGQIDDPTSANTQTQISEFLVGNLERIFLACYVTTSQFTGSTNYGFDRIVDELTLIGNSAISQSKVAKVAIIYHGGIGFMNSYFQQYGFDSAYNNFINVYNSWSNESKNGIDIIGYIIYGYQQVRNLTP